ncbi:MAG: PH domain-containing protein [Chloroflexi bacterium]|jgi:hypothetical protein|nr:PH domain-containing protein [Chloroflexota bacterium]
MFPREAQARIKARIWQSVAQSDLDLSALDKNTMETLVDLVTSEALVEMDEQLGESWTESEALETPATAEELGSETENILWEGRPFLSVSMHYTVTDERIHISEGMFGKTHHNIELVRVQDVDFSQSISERFLNLGDIRVRSHDPSTPAFSLINVRDPQEVFTILRRAVRDARKKQKLTFQEEM